MAWCLPDRRPDVRLARIVLVRRRKQMWRDCGLGRERVVRLLDRLRLGQGRLSQTAEANVVCDDDHYEDR
jgi:hypothetical protein